MLVQNRTDWLYYIQVYIVYNMEISTECCYKVIMGFLWGYNHGEWLLILTGGEPTDRHLYVNMFCMIVLSIYFDWSPCPHVFKVLLKQDNLIETLYTQTETLINSFNNVTLTEQKPSTSSDSSLKTWFLWHLCPLLYIYFYIFISTPSCIILCWVHHFLPRYVFLCLHEVGGI